MGEIWFDGKRGVAVHELVRPQHSSDLVYSDNVYAEFVSKQLSRIGTNTIAPANGEHYMSSKTPVEPESRLLSILQSIAISPKDAEGIAVKYREQSRRAAPNASEARHQERAADKIIGRYAKLAAVSGGVTALTGVVPGVGTALALLGGGLADTAVCMKLQVDMTMCIAALFDWDLNTEDGKHISFLIAAGGTLEKVGTETATKLASKAGVSMLRQYLKGAALQVVKAFFKRIGIIFTRKALEKALPFGIGVGIGSTANYALTKYVGNSAKGWFMIDRDNNNHPGGA